MISSWEFEIRKYRCSELPNPAVERDWPKAAFFMAHGNLNILGSGKVCSRPAPHFHVRYKKVGTSVHLKLFISAEVIPGVWAHTSLGSQETTAKK